MELWAQFHQPGTRKLLETIYSFTEVGRYKISLEKKVYTNNKHNEKEIMDILLSIVISKAIKYLGI